MSEINVVIRIMPVGEELEVELDVAMTGIEIKEHFISEGLVPGNQPYDLYCKANGFKIDDNKTLESAGVNEGYTLYLAPANINPGGSSS